jgi:branched-chain amino acid transport system substrate-binding protein
MLLLLCAFGLGAGSAPAQIAPPEESEALFAQALEQFRSGRYEEAFTRFESLYRAPAHARKTAAGLMAGRALLALGQFRSGAAWLEAFLEAYPQSRYAPEACWSLAYAYWALHREDRALEALLRGWRRAEGQLRQQLEERFWALSAAFQPEGLDSLAAHAEDPVFRAMLQLAIVRHEIGRWRFEEASDRLARLRPLPAELRALHTELEAAVRARRVLAFPDTASVTPYRIGVFLPAANGGGSDWQYSWELLRGLELAVEEHNQRRWDRPLRLIFRNSAPSEGSIQDAFRELLEIESVDLVVGPLYSREAAEIVDMAEDARLPLILPLANEEQLVDERQWVFQINPPASVHARTMARFAVEKLGIKRVAVLFRPSEREAWLAEVFATELEAAGGSVLLREALSGSRQRVSAELVERLRALSPEALYISLAGEDTENAIENMLGRFEELAYWPPRILGGAVWHELRSSWSRLARFRVTYTAEGRPEPRMPDYGVFRSAYRARFREDPGLLALVGYDVGRWLSSALQSRMPGEPLRDALRRTGPFEGVRLRIDFRYGNVNPALRVLQYQGGRIVELP